MLSVPLFPEEEEEEDAVPRPPVPPLLLLLRDAFINTPRLAIGARVAQSAKSENHLQLPARDERREAAAATRQLTLRGASPAAASHGLL
jgi:hypothetical protein